MMRIELEKSHGIWGKLIHFNWGFVFLLCIVALIGGASLYSAGGGNLSPWALNHLVRFGIGLAALLFVALIDIKWWYRLTWPIYFAGFGLLIVVEIMGHIGMGAQRWIDLGFIKLQPSELMKIAVIMALARYFHSHTPDEMKKIRNLIVPAVIALAPVGLVLIQPNLGTSLMIVIGSATMFFFAGAPVWLFLLGIGGVAASVPVAWQFLHEYQKKRVMTFLNPEEDPLGAGYNIIQSKIALGSGGISGKGFLEGTQSRLNFLPEKQTDFIFTLWAEEWGLAGGLFLLGVIGMIFTYCFILAMRARHNYGRYLILGLSVNFSLYIFINTAMVMGLIPVVGIPFPLVSYGGTSMLAAMIGFGLILSCNFSRDVNFRRGL
jgi:rod shape determining protein RodA